MIQFIISCNWSIILEFQKLIFIQRLQDIFGELTSARMSERISKFPSCFCFELAAATARCCLIGHQVRVMGASTWHLAKIEASLVHSSSISGTLLAFGG